MKNQQQRIRYRIILPFTLLFCVMTLLYGAFSVYFFTRYLDQDLASRMDQVAGVISNAGFALNPAILRQLKNVVEAEILVVDAKGELLNSTFAAAVADAAKHQLRQATVDSHQFQKNFVVAETSYRVMVFPLALSGRAPATLSLWMPLAGASALKLKIYLGITGVAILGIIAMSFAGYFIARSITAPVENLVHAAEKIAAGDLEQRVPLSRQDEIGRLANAFNQMVAQFKEYEQRLVESEKMTTAGQLAAGFAHEIRNPLTSIKLFGQVLQQRLQDQPDSQKMLLSMVTEIDRLDRVIQNMINRIKPGDLQRDWHDLNQQLAEILPLATVSLTAQGIVVEEAFSAALPKVYLDSEKIKQLLWNLLLNAKEAMPAGGTCRISTCLLENDRVQLLVEDSGCGIPDDAVEQLFVPFFTTKPEGLGLGLGMCRQIVEQHGGSLELKNRPDKGAAAYVVLPVGDC